MNSENCCSAADTAAAYKYIEAQLADLKPEENVRFSCADDIAMGELFANVFKGCLRYNETAAAWMHYDGAVWREDPAGLAADALAKLLQRALYIRCADLPDGSAFRKRCVKLSELTMRRRMISDAMSFFPCRQSDFDAQPYLLNVQNGVLDLRTRTLLDHAPDLMLSKICNAKFEPDADGSTVNTFISQVMCDDAEKAKYLRAALGYSLLGTSEQEQMFLAVGTSTRNGKSTLFDSVRFMLGDYGCTVEPQSLATRDRNTTNASGDLARLAGTRFVQCSEPPRKMNLDVALVKSLTGRDSITARHLYQREFEYVPQFALWMNSNNFPQVNDPTLFTSGRIKVIEFNRHFGPHEQDTGLKERLRKPENLSALLNFCLDGLADYLSAGHKLIPPQSVVSATEAYAERSDKFANFIREALVEFPGAAVTAKRAYVAFENWCRENGFGVDSKAGFLEAMRTKGLLRARATVNGRTQTNVIVGFTLDVDQFGNDRNPFSA